jgi:hypothetical protein
MFTRPRLLPQAITFAIYGYHFRKTFENRVGLNEGENSERTGIPQKRNFP